MWISINSQAWMPSTALIRNLTHRHYILIAKINSLNPKPGCWFGLKGSRIKVLEAKEIKVYGKPGEILNDKFTIGCNENAVQILQLKKEGKNSMSASDFLIGNTLKVGKNLNEL